MASSTFRRIDATRRGKGLKGNLAFINFFIFEQLIFGFFWGNLIREKITEPK